VVGSNALINEVELLQIIDEVYTRLNLNVVIKINNRKLLAALSEVAQIPEKLIDMTVAIDKLDKIGLEGVVKELEKREFSGFAIDTITQVLACKTIPELERLLGDNEQGKLGIAEMNEILAMVNLAPLNNVLELDFTLARGLSYYTGTIIEVKAADVVMGSLNGGGRYDNLTGLFGLPNLSGVGISFGLDRVYDVLDELNLFPSDAEQNVKLLFVSFDKTTYLHAFQLLQQVRKKGISAELYPDSSKIKKQMQYANDRQIPFVAIIGEEEVTNNQITLKNMLEGSQSKVSIESLILQLG
jgi:histidyl-tRNA synthetase